MTHPDENIRETWRHGASHPPTAFDTSPVKLAAIRLCVSNSLHTARIFNNYRVSNPTSSNASTPPTSGPRQDWEVVSTSLTSLTQRFWVCHPRGNIKCRSLSTFAPSTPSSKPITMSSPAASLLSANARWAEATDPALFERCAKGQSPKVCVTSYQFAVLPLMTHCPGALDRLLRLAYPRICRDRRQSRRHICSPEYCKVCLPFVSATRSLMLAFFFPAAQPVSSP